MGSPTSEAHRQRGERKTACLSKGCWLEKYEVTRERWKKVMGYSVRIQASGFMRTDSDQLKNDSLTI